MLSVVMQTLDTTIANVALPHMQGSMSATQDQIAWVLTSYIVASAIAMPATGFLAARFGRMQLMLASIAGFTIASMLCGASTNLEEIVFFRIVQGVCGASFIPISQSILLDSYPLEQRGRVIAMWSMGVMIGPILGPALGGWLTESYSWRWVFYINVPFGILAFFGMWLGAPKTLLDKTRKFDWIGFAFLSIAIGSLQLMLDRGNGEDWFSSTEIILETALAAMALYLYIAHTFTTKEHPFVEPRLFKDQTFLIGIGVSFIVGLILYATMALLPPYLQGLMGYPVVTTGLVTAPRGFGSMLSMMICGRLIGRIDQRLLIAFGVGLTAWSLWEMSRFNLYMDESLIIWTGIIQGFGLGFVFVPVNTLTFATLAPALRGDGTSFYNLIRNIGSSIGISLSVAMVARMTQANHSILTEHISPLNPLLRPGATEGWQLKSAQALAMIDAEITRQAAAIAYVNDFKIMMYLSLLVLPMLLLVKIPAAPRDAPKETSPVMD